MTENESDVPNPLNEPYFCQVSVILVWCYIHILNFYPHPMRSYAHGQVSDTNLCVDF